MYSSVCLVQVAMLTYNVLLSSPTRITPSL
jgi:hypothetical protein